MLLGAVLHRTREQGPRGKRSPQLRNRRFQVPEALSQHLDLAAWGDIKKQHLFAGEFVIDELLFVIRRNFTRLTWTLKDLVERRALPAR